LDSESKKSTLEVRDGCSPPRNSYNYLSGDEAAQWWASSNRACVVVRPHKKCVGICEGLGGDGASEAGEMSEAGEASGVSETIEARRCRSDAWCKGGRRTAK
jgi:hypothetical protein